MTISQLLHATLLVSDLQRSQQFYQDILELVPAERSLSFPGLWYQLGAQQLHLIHVDQVKPDLVNPEKWGRNRHLAFGIADLAPLKQKLAIHHIPFQMSSSGRAALFTQDPDGNIIELTEISA